MASALALHSKPPAVGPSSSAAVAPPPALSLKAQRVRPAAENQAVEASGPSSADPPHALMSDSLYPKVSIETAVARLAMDGESDPLPLGKERQRQDDGAQGGFRRRPDGDEGPSSVAAAVAARSYFRRASSPSASADVGRSGGAGGEKPSDDVAVIFEVHGQNLQYQRSVQAKLTVGSENTLLPTQVVRMHEGPDRAISYGQPLTVLQTTLSQVRCLSSFAFELQS